MRNPATSFSATKKFVRVFVAALFMTALSPVNIHALSDKDLNTIGNDTIYYDDTVVDNTCSCPLPTSGTTSGAVYQLGDSLTVGMQGEGGLVAKYKVAPALSPTINGLVSRNISGSSPSPNGLDQAKQDQAVIAKASAVVIELGTNSDSSFEQSAKGLLAEIKGYNTQANIYWMNGGTNVNTARMTAQNAFLKTLGVTVIDWDNLLKQHLDWVADPASQGIHPNASGYDAMAKLVVDSVKHGATSVSGCGALGTTLTGSDNASKAWNYLIAKGLNPPQVAGILGNLMQESHINPRSVQSNNVGHGIAQWSLDGRWNGVLKLAQIQNQSEWDLGLQLDYMWSELTGKTQWADALPAVKATSTYADAALAFEVKFEGAGNPVMTARIQFAKEILARYGGTVAPAPGSADTSAANGCAGSGVVQGDLVKTAVGLAWPDDSKAHGDIMNATPAFKAAVAKGVEPTPEYGYTDCSVFIATVMKKSGVDPNYPYYTFNQLPYVEAHPEKFIVNLNPKSIADLQPGDVLIVNNNSQGGNTRHTMMYVGPQPGSSYQGAQASLGAEVPMMTKLGDVLWMLQQPGVISVRIK